MNEGEELMARWLADDLGEEETRDLMSRLETDAELQQQLGRQLAVDGMLGVMLEDELARERAESRILGALPTGDGEDFLKGIEGKIDSSRRRAMVGWMAAAAAIVLVAGLTWMRPGPVATVVGVGSLDPAAPFSVGMKFREGQEIHLGSGLMEISLKRGGRMILEGPAELKWLGPDRALLAQGRLRLQQPDGGKGFRVMIPGGEVSEATGDFGVKVAAGGGEVEIHSLQGEAMAVMGNRPAGKVRENDALRWVGLTEDRMPADPGAFYSGLPPQSRDLPKMIHWPMDLGRGGIVGGNSSDFGAGNFDFISLGRKSTASPAAVAGKIGGAVSFDGKGSFMESAFPGIGGNHPRTVCLWVKVPRDFDPLEGFAMVSWGQFGSASPGSVWQISVNPLAADGPLGCLRLGAHGGIAIGSRDLRDGEWHHVAVVFYPAARPSVGKHVLLYIDGKLDPLSRRTLGEVWTEVQEADHGVWLGRDVTLPENTTRPGGFFRGALDEVYIFGGALSQDQVRSVMENRLPE